jgi:hypothetical protein
MRALSSAIVLLTATCFGQGVGPLVMGTLNLKADFGANAVRYPLLSTSVTTALGALLFVWAARAILGDIQRAIYAQNGIWIQSVTLTTVKPGEKSPKTARMKPFCGTRETILKQSRRNPLSIRDGKVRREA